MKIVLAVLACVSKILVKMDKMVIVEEVLPILFDVRLADVNVLIRVLGKEETFFMCCPMATNEWSILRCLKMEFMNGSSIVLGLKIRS